MYILIVILQASLLMAGPLPSNAPLPQEEEEQITAVKDDLNFAVSLARNRYFDLADTFVEKIKGGHLSDEEKDTLTLTNARILTLAADNSTEDEERLDFYRRALEQFNEFVQYNTHHPLFDQIKFELAQVYKNLGIFLSQLMEKAEDATTRANVKKEAEETFRTGVQHYNDVSSSLRTKADAYRESGMDDVADQNAAEARTSEYNKGIAYYQWAMIYDADEFNREDYLDRCISTMDDYIWESSEDEFFTLWAYLYQAMAYEEFGEYEDALDLARQVIDPTTGCDLDQATALAPQYAKMITDVVETSYKVVGRILYKMEKYEDVNDTVTRMKDEFASRSLEISPIGDEARLVQVDALLAMQESEKTNKAAQIARDVAERNPKNYVGWRARIKLQEIIEGPKHLGTEIVLSPEVLFAAADGARAKGDLLAAIKGYMRVFDAVKTKQQNQTFTAKTWASIGECYKKMGRHLESAIAFEQGFRKADRSAEGRFFESCALSWHSELQRRYKVTRHPFDEKFMKDATNELVKLNVSKNLRFMIAQERFDKALVLTGDERVLGMQDALDEFAQMEKQSAFYERALVFQARCYYEMGKYEEALKAFDAAKNYIRSAGPPGTPEQVTNRSAAEAMGAYWKAETLLRLDRHMEVLATLRDFEDRYAKQKSFFAPVMYDRILAYLGLEKFQDAEKHYKDLLKKFPQSDQATSSAYYIGKSYINKAEILKGDDATAPPPPDYAKLLKRGTEYMLTYCEGSGFDSFTNLKYVCECYKELGEIGEKGALEKSEEIYKKLMKIFGKDPQYKEVIETSVYRGYAEVLNQLHKFQEARPYWMRLRAANPQNVGILRATAFCLGGWLESDGRSFIEIPGSGDYAPELDASRDPKIVSYNNAYTIWGFLLKGISDREEGEKSDDWYEAKFYTAYCLYRAGMKEPNYFVYATRIINNLRVIHPDMGGKEWRAKFNYIEKAISKKK